MSYQLNMTDRQQQQKQILQLLKFYTPAEENWNILSWKDEYLHEIFTNYVGK